MLFQTHLDGPPLRKQPEREIVASSGPESDAARYEPKVRAQVIADREYRAKVIGHPLEVLEELHRQVAQDREALLPDTRARELDLRMVLSRIRNRLGRFVIHAERELATALALETQSQDLAQATGEVNAMSIVADATLVLRMLAEFEKGPEDARRGRHNLTQHGVAATLKETWKTEMSPERVNDAVDVLERKGYVEVNRGAGTTPYRFSGVALTPTGRLEHEAGIQRMQVAASEATAVRLKEGKKVFIGHGRSPVWRDLKDFVRDRLHLDYDEFNREPTAGQSTKERLEQMLDDAAFAFLVMTGEDERSHGAAVARQNVVHEVGLFQGRLGFMKAIVLLEEGCAPFSNIDGLTHIPFDKGNIAAKFEEIRRVLEREEVLPKQPK